MSTQIAPEPRIYRKQLRTFRIGLRNQLLTSRFTTSTWNENINYRKRYPDVGCVYCSPGPITKIITVDANIFMLEMNNDTNQILGVGLIQNKPTIGKLNVYDRGNYNRYTFIGKMRIDRQDMNEEEVLVMNIFDILCFRGNKHMKRGQGLTSFPTELLYMLSKKIDLLKYIGNMFKRRILQNENRTIK